MITGIMNKAYAHTRPARTHDGQGGWTKTSETSLGTLRGYDRDLTPVERSEAEKITGRVTHAITIHPTEDVRRNDVLQESGRTLRVKSIRQTQGRTRKILMCESEQEGA